jgi:hypothetical protein
MGSVPKVRGLLWREHPLGSQTHPITKCRGDWWISWKCRSRHRHREKVGEREVSPLRTTIDAEPSRGGKVSARAFRKGRWRPSSRTSPPGGFGIMPGL